MTLEDLRVLVAVADHLNLSATARTLGCTQAAVSQHIRRLETELGTHLLLRGRRGSVLTTAGERYALAAVEALGALARGGRAVEALSDPAAGPLRIATSGSTFRHFMAPAIAAFRHRHPDTRVELYSSGSTRRCLATVQRDQADLAFITLGDPPPDIDTRPAIETLWTLVSPLGTAGQPHAETTMAKLAPLHHISLHPATVSAGELNRQLAEAQVAMAPETSVDDWDTAVALVDLGLGVAVVPAIHAHNLRASYRVSVTPIRDLAPLRFGWATVDHGLLSAPARAFVEVFETHHDLDRPPHTRSLNGDWQRRA